MTNQIKGKELRVIYCPTEEMVEDFYTKPLQGMLFIKHRNTILGINDGNFSRYEQEYAECMKGIEKP